MNQTNCRSAILCDLRWSVLVAMTVGAAELHAAFVTAGRMDSDAVLGVLAYAGAAGGLVVVPFTTAHLLFRRGMRVSALRSRSLLTGILLGGFLFLRAITDAIWHLWVSIQWDSNALAVCLGISLSAAAALTVVISATRRLAMIPGRQSYPAVALATLVMIYGGFLVRWVAGAQGFQTLILYLASSAGLAGLSLRIVLQIPVRRAWALFGVAALVPVGVRFISQPSELSVVRAEPLKPQVSAVEGNNAPNVVLIVLDTVRADHLELYGYERNTMPNLTALASQGTTFLDAISTASWTLPAHASLFTGLYPVEHGADRGASGSKHPGWSGLHPLPNEVPVLAEVLRDAGYSTSGVSANWGFLRPYYGLARGFDYWDSRATFHGAACVEGYLPVILRTASLVDHLPIRWVFWPLERWDLAQVKVRRAEEINREVFARLETLVPGGRRPFLLFVNYMDAHNPYLPPWPFRDRFPGRRRDMPWRYFGAMRAGLSGEELCEHLGSQYDSALAYLDYHLGQLFDSLKEKAIWEDTLIIVTSDHGEALGEHGHVNHGNSVYEEEIRIPLVIVDPTSNDRGATVTQPVDLRYVMPWLIQRLKLDLPAGVEPPGPASGGFSQVSQAYGAPGKPRTDPSVKLTDQIAVRGRGTKAIVFSTGQVELYDLLQDPGENRDLSNERPEVAQLLRSEALSWLAERTRDKPDSDLPLSQQQIDRLRELGYVR